MTDPQQPQQPSGDLQFEHVEGKKCAACGQPLRDVYYDVNGQTLCESCRRAAEATWSRGSSAGRFFKAVGLGVAAAAAGTALYYAVLALTGYEIGLIAIAVGFLVGFAVRKGSQGRGGWQYQALAMFLTYTSIVTSYIPLIVQEISKQESVITPESPDSAVARIGGDVVAIPVEPTAASTQDEDLSSPAGLVLAILALIGLIYAIPFLAGFENILGLVIIGIGVYEAWKLNRRAELKVTGPFKVNA